MKDNPTPVGLEAPSPTPWATYAFLSFCLIAVHAAIVHFRFPEVMGGALIDPDSYTRLIRVAQLQEGGRWFDGVIARMNAPFGLEIHWTRPLDVILLGSSWVLSPIFGSRGALFWSGAFLSPTLHILTCLSLAWAVVPLLDAERRPLVIITLLAQPVLTSYAVAGRADHHILLVLLYVLSLGCFFRSITRPGKSGSALASGALAGLGLWVSIEFLLPLVTLYATLTLLWLVGCPKTAWKGLLFSAGLLAVVLVALVAEHPPSKLLLPEFDRISASHALLALLAVGFWSGVLALKDRVPVRGSILVRSALLFLGVFLFLGTVSLTYPGIFSNPMTDLDPQFWTLFLSHIEELQPLFPRNLSDVGLAVVYMGAAILGIPFSLWMLLPRHGERTRAVWVPVACALGIFVPLGLYQLRYAIWAGVPLAIAIVGLLARVIQWLEYRTTGSLRTLARATLIAGIITGPLFLGGLLMTLWGKQGLPSAQSSEIACSVGQLALSLSEGVYGNLPQTLVTGPDIGPELVYRTHHLVVAAPYHRNPAGILDTYEMLASTQDTVSRALMSRRAVDLVILCPDQDRAFFQQLNASDQTLFVRLADGRAPAWLRPVELPGLLQSGYLVFEVGEE